MEYSGHITVDMGERVDVLTVYHEVAHQWFYYLVGNDENEEAWLDESFASFCSYLCQEEAGDEKAPTPGGISAERSPLVIPVRN